MYNIFYCDTTGEVLAIPETGFLAKLVRRISGWTFRKLGHVQKVYTDDLPF